jgi:hypothetical protein
MTKSSGTTRPDLRNNVAFQLAVDIRQLGLRMVRLDEWTREAQELEQWQRVGELEAQRFDVQERRSNLMVEQWLAERRQNRRTRARDD